MHHSGPLVGLQGTVCLLATAAVAGAGAEAEGHHLVLLLLLPAMAAVTAEGSLAFCSIWNKAAVATGSGNSSAAAVIPAAAIRVAVDQQVQQQQQAVVQQQQDQAPAVNKLTLISTDAWLSGFGTT
jgi:hypothetical protein